MTYNVFGGTLSLTQSINQSVIIWSYFMFCILLYYCCPSWQLIVRSSSTLYMIVINVNYCIILTGTCSLWWAATCPYSHRSSGTNKLQYGVRCNDCGSDNHRLVEPYARCRQELGKQAGSSQCRVWCITQLWCILPQVFWHKPLVCVCCVLCWNTLSFTALAWPVFFIFIACLWIRAVLLKYPAICDFFVFAGNYCRTHSVFWAVHERVCVM